MRSNHDLPYLTIFGDICCLAFRTRLCLFLVISRQHPSLWMLWTLFAIQDKGCKKRSLVRNLTDFFVAIYEGQC